MFFRAQLLNSRQSLSVSDPGNLLGFYEYLRTDGRHGGPAQIGVGFVLQSSCNTEEADRRFATVLFAPSDGPRGYNSR
jgi:hypothetical protein